METITKTAETTKKKKILQNPFQGPFEASNPVQAKEEGARLPCVGFKNLSNGWGSKDQSETSPRFTSNSIHTKSGVDNLYGNGIERSLGASQVSI